METYPLHMIPASEPPVEGMSMRRVATKFSRGGFNVKQTFNVQNVYQLLINRKRSHCGEISDRGLDRKKLEKVVGKCCVELLFFIDS